MFKLSTTLYTTLAATVMLAHPLAGRAAEEKPVAEVCAIDGKPVDAKFKVEYEGKAYPFCSEACAQQFSDDREASLYQQIGGKPALTAAVELFYVKVLADDRVNHFFEDINMAAQKRKQQEFLAAALGSPEPWTGKDLRRAHKNLELRDEDFAAIAENLQATLTELKLDEALIGKIMTLVGSTKDAVLNKETPS